MSELVNDEDIHASKNPDKPPRLPYNAWLLKMGKLVENSAIKEAKTNDRKHKPVKNGQVCRSAYKPARKKCTSTAETGKYPESWYPRYQV